jgi:hypothetical protein
MAYGWGLSVGCARLRWLCSRRPLNAHNARERRSHCSEDGGLARHAFYSDRHRDADARQRRETASKEHTTDETSATSGQAQNYAHMCSCAHATVYRQVLGLIQCTIRFLKVETRTGVSANSEDHLLRNSLSCVRCIVADGVSLP